MFLIHAALRLLTGNVLMSAFQTLSVGNTVQWVPATGRPAALGTEVAAGAAATPPPAARRTAVALTARRLISGVSAAGRPRYTNPTDHALSACENWDIHGSPQRDRGRRDESTATTYFARIGGCRNHRGAAAARLRRSRHRGGEEAGDVRRQAHHALPAVQCLWRSAVRTEDREVHAGD